MKKIEADTLEEAYAKAAKVFDCSITDLEYEIVQHPSKGFLGIGAKKAIIVAACKTASPSERTDTESPLDPDTSADSKEQPIVSADSTPHHAGKDVDENMIHDADESASKILEGFFDENGNNTTHAPRSEAQLSREIEERLSALMQTTCFEIDTVEVDVIDGTAYIFIDGEDAALLIGKEGYRYNALSYLLYNWIHNEYDLFVKLEIAQFLASQQEMIRNYIQPVIEHVHQHGWGKTRPLDGILVHIALEQLREEFPNKYVAIKRTRQGERYILINEFNKRS
jgi:spoIIIJ-associated protein